MTVIFLSFNFLVFWSVSVQIKRKLLLPLLLLSLVILKWKVH